MDTRVGGAINTFPFLHFPAPTCSAEIPSMQMRLWMDVKKETSRSSLQTFTSLQATLTSLWWRRISCRPLNLRARLICRNVSRSQGVTGNTATQTGTVIPGTFATLLHLQDTEKDVVL